MRDEAIYTETRHGLTIKIYPEEYPLDPRENDNLGTMVCFHRRHKLGDKHTMSVEEVKEFTQRKDIVWLPLYLYDHSGITMSTSNKSYPFTCPWDAMQVGIIYITKAEIKKEFGTADQKSIEKTLNNFRAQVKEYDDYLTGNVYGYVIEDKEGEHLESCYGYSGDYNNKDFSALTEARHMVDSITENGKTDEKGQVLADFPNLKKQVLQSIADQD